MANIDNSYAKLPENFYERVLPTKVSHPELIKLNDALAEELGLDSLPCKSLAAIFSGNEIYEGFEPIAQAYAGHQFGHFVPQLGDGRAILLAELINSNGARKDVQLKGAGRTSFSRSGDGRAWLGPVIREYIVSEAMHALGIPTTRSLAIVSTGETILREKELPGAILTRVASSHIRVGSFEYFAARNDSEALKVLADYTIERHYPEIKKLANPYLGLLEQVSLRQQELVSDWMKIGFIHGVMNTDNSSIAGETIDYGPCAFMDFYKPDIVFSSIDRFGRYAYNNQGKIAFWNLYCFANTLIGLIDQDEDLAIEKIREILGDFFTCFEQKTNSKLLMKIGLKESKPENLSLLEELLDLMQKYRADFTLTFRKLIDLANENPNFDRFLELFDKKEHSDSQVKNWFDKWKSKISNNEARELMQKNNPIFIPRNHLIEKAIDDAHHHKDYQMVNNLIKCLSKPFEYQEEFASFTQAPLDKDLKYLTFCGT